MVATISATTTITKNLRCLDVKVKDKPIKATDLNWFIGRVVGTQNNNNNDGNGGGSAAAKYSGLRP